MSSLPTNFLFTSPAHIVKTAPSRGLSPGRSTSSRSTHNPTQKMPSPRSSPAMRPQSPLSPQYNSPARFEMLQPPSPRAMHSRPVAGNNQRRANTNSLKLPSLPRFHPANYPSTHHSSVQNTHDTTGMGAPQPPASPRAHQRVFSDAQKHLMAYQREQISIAARGTSPSRFDNPESPRLAPLGSPGPVTPLELESEDSYLVAGARSAVSNDGGTAEELMERLIREEAGRSRTPRTSSQSPSRTTGR